MKCDFCKCVSNHNWSWFGVLLSDRSYAYAYVTTTAKHADRLVTQIQSVHLPLAVQTACPKDLIRGNKSDLPAI